MVSDINLRPPAQNREYSFKGIVMQIEKTLINDRLRVLKVS